MSTEFLDKSGLTYFWSKIKAWCNAAFALIGHVHPSSDVTLMTGYSKPSSGSSIASSDTLNQAVGKLEAKLDAVPVSVPVPISDGGTGASTRTDAVRALLNEGIVSPGFFLTCTTGFANAGFTSVSNVKYLLGLSSSDYADDVVHKSGAETISGSKTLTGVTRYSALIGTTTGLGGTTDAFALKRSVSADTNVPIIALYDSESSLTSGFQDFYETNGNNRAIIFAYRKRNSDGTSNGYASFGVVATPSSSGDYAFAPTTPSDITYNNAIITKGYSDSKFVHLSGAENISGSKTFGYTVTIGRAYALCRDVHDESFVISSGPDFGEGSQLTLIGKNRSTNPGNFYLYARTGSYSRYMYGTPNGSLYWNGQAIQTSSDERLKTPLADPPAEVLDAWEDVRWGQFQFLDAVGEKGSSARLHVGLIAQAVGRAFAARGLDACRYGILCHELHEASEDVPAEDLWTVRYVEALCMEASYMRRENARLKKRVADLEDRLAALELRIGSE